MNSATQQVLSVRFRWQMSNVPSWHNSDLPLVCMNVCLLRNSGTRLLDLSLTGFDPNRTFAEIYSCSLLATCSSVLWDGCTHLDVKMMRGFLCAQRLIQRDSWAILQVSLHKNNVHISL
jgi:hypothetical protein